MQNSFNKIANEKSFILYRYSRAKIKLIIKSQYASPQTFSNHRGATVWWRGAATRKKKIFVDFSQYYNGIFQPFPFANENKNIFVHKIEKYNYNI